MAERKGTQSRKGKDGDLIADHEGECRLATRLTLDQKSPGSSPGGAIK